jgi:uncharacterized protein (TIGR03083 family)
MNSTVHDISSIARITHDEAMAITAVENQRFMNQLRSLTPAQWSTPTECDLWDVRAMAAHLVGSAASQISPIEMFRQVRKGRPIVRDEIPGGFWWDGMNEVQVRERADLSTDELIAEWEDLSGRALKARRRMPRPLSALRLLNLPAPVGRQPLRYLFDMGFTRDVWAHRIDIAHATGLELELTTEHDGRILEDVVAEWASYFDEPFTLEVEGPAGSTFTRGDGGEPVRISVIDLVRTLAERIEGDGVLRHTLPL